MRALVFSFALAGLAVGCGPGPDPNLGDCATRKEGAVIIGTGEDDFTPIPSTGVRINSGSQGGQHIWIGLSCKHLGPRVTVHLAITDVETGVELTEHGLAVAVDLDYDGEGSDLAHGIYGYLSRSPGGDGEGGGGGAAPMLPGDLTGRKIKIEADVADDCGKPAIHAELTTKIAGG